jgi:hypothetical protein
MPEQDVKAGELNKAVEVLDVVLPSGDEAGEVMHPGEEPFHSRTPTIAASLASILSLTSALPVGRDQFDVVFVSAFLVERVGVVRPCRRLGGLAIRRGNCRQEPLPQAGTRPAKRFAHIRREEDCS